ncbi:MAG: hypothetical protein WC220_10960, partial [Pedobacter sp.]
MNKKIFPQPVWILLLAISIALPIAISAQDKLQSNGHIPILGWYSIPPEEATPARYREMREAGFD